MKMMSSMDGPYGSSSSSSNSRPSRLITPAPAPAPVWQYEYPVPAPAPVWQYEYPVPAPAPVWQYGYPVPEHKISSPVAYNMVSNAQGYSYSRFGNDTYNSIPDIGWDHGDFENKDNRPYMIRWKSGKKVDNRLLMVLESFYQEIYIKRKDFFQKIFPGTNDQFEDVFSKIDVMLQKNNNRVKHQTLRRSLSVGSPRRHELFKVKTPAVIIGNPDGQGGGGTSEPPATGFGK